MVVPFQCWGELKAAKSMTGISGEHSYAVERVSLGVRTDAGMFRLLNHTTIDVGLLTMSDLTNRIPSLLGRDIMQYGNLTIGTGNPGLITLDLPGTDLAPIPPTPPAT
jgi:hypothetical protein